MTSRASREGPAASVRQPTRARGTRTPGERGSARVAGPRLARLGLALLLVATGCGSEPPPAPAEPAVPARRVVSLNPSLTAILVALGAADRLVGVDSFSARQQPAVADLHQVGGLYNPSLEAVVALDPDLVVVVPSAEQRSFRARLRELGVPLLELDPVDFEDVLESIEVLGARVGAGKAAGQRVAAIRRARAEVERATRDLPHPRTVLVLQRDPFFVVGSGGFADQMLASAGARNLAAEFDTAYPRVSREWLIQAAPEVILDSSPGAAESAAFWQRWPSLPAVARDRVVGLEVGVTTLPGPFLDRALWVLARAVHGPALAGVGE